MIRRAALPALVLLSAMVLPLSAADVYVWNFDDEDVFYCSEAGSTVDCAYWIEETLDAAGHSVTTGTTLPSDLGPYDVVFVTLGWYRC